MIIGRNDPCHCGSGKKYKKCHLEQDEMKNQKKRQEAALNAVKVAAEDEKKEGSSQSDAKKNDIPDRKKGWFKEMVGKVGFVRSPSSRRNIPQNKGG